MNQTVYLGDTGTVIRLDCKADISAATVRSIDGLKPDGSEVSMAAVADGTTAITATSLATTFDMPGEWRLWSQVTLPAGQWRGKTAFLTVLPANR